MKSRIFDVILAVTIAVSGGFVTYRLLRGKNTLVSPAPERAKILPSPTSPGEKIETIAPPIRPSWKIGSPDAATLLLATKSYNATEWGALIKQSSLGNYSVFETDACKKSDSNPIPAFVIFNADMLEKFRKGTMPFFLDVNHRTCVRKNAVVPVISVGRLLDEPIFSHEGTVEINDIIHLPGDKASENVLNLVVSLPPERITELFTKIVQQGDGAINLLKISKLKSTSPPEAPALPYPITPNGTTIRRARLKQYLQRHPDVIVVDVRSTSESNQQPIQHSGAFASVPYTVSKETPSWSFSWKRTVADVDKDTFDIAKVVSLRTSSEKPIMIVGAAPSDGRPAWALWELAKVNVGNLVWFYEGAAEFNNAVNER